MLYEIEGYNDEKLIDCQSTTNFGEALLIADTMCDDLECVIILSVYQKGDLYHGVQQPVGQRNVVHVYYN